LNDVGGSAVAGNELVEGDGKGLPVDGTSAELVGGGESDGSAGGVEFDGLAVVCGEVERRVGSVGSAGETSERSEASEATRRREGLATPAKRGKWVSEPRVSKSGGGASNSCLEADAAYAIAAGP